MSAKDGGPAFPCHTNPRPDYLSNAPQGMSLRDWFAGMALAGLPIPMTGPIVHAAFAEDAYRTADAMLAAREGKEVA